MSVLGCLCFMVLMYVAALILDEKPNYGWFLSFLMIFFHIEHKESSYLLIAALFAIAGSITGHGRRLADVFKDKKKDA